MGKVMTDNVTVIRYNDKLEQTDAKLQELLERYKKVDINDGNMWGSQALPHGRQLYNMLELARVITLGALQRNESRGAHYKPDFPNRDDANFLGTTIATYSPEGPELSYEKVDISLIPPRARKYDADKGKGGKEVAPNAAQKENKIEERVKAGVPKDTAIVAESEKPGHA